MECYCCGVSLDDSVEICPDCGAPLKEKLRCNRAISGECTATGCAHWGDHKPSYVYTKPIRGTDGEIIYGFICTSAENPEPCVTFGGLARCEATM